MDTAYTGNQIATRRKALGMTQKDLAEKLHVTDKAVSKWERGINFPDLGLMDSLASALDTTPASLLGLEEANRDEVLSTVTQISEQQLEETQRDVKWLGWGCLLAAALLTVVYFLYGNSVRETQTAFQTLALVIFTGTGSGLWLLVKYGQIRKFDIPEILLFYGVLFPVLFYLGIQFFTGRSPGTVLGFCLIAAPSCAAQLLFWRIMKPGLAKALPLILSALYALWRIPGEFPFRTEVLVFALPAMCCLVIWGICLGIGIAKQTVKPLPSRTAVAVALVCLVLMSVFFYTSIVRIYVLLRHDHLEDYAQTLLTQESGIIHDSYGPWDVTAYPEHGMVEFRVGGSGIVPSSTYEGFYYSADNAHIPFQGMDVPQKVSGDTARWTDGTDNWGQSARIHPGWFWYEASF